MNSICWRRLSEEKRTVLVPPEFSHVPIANMLSSEDQDSIIPVYRPGDDIFLSMVHVALSLKLREDILAHPTYTGLKITKEAEMTCIPDSL